MTKQQLIYLQGIPASGKSTWAKEKVLTGLNFKRLNKDDLRNMIDAGKWSKENEKFIVSTERSLAKDILDRGYNLIIDNTGFSPTHEEYYSDLTRRLDVDFEKIFFDVSLEEAIERDSKREDSVGEEVITKMYDENLIPKIEKNPELPNALIVDIDGTLAHMSGRSPYDPSKYHEDTVDEIVREIVRTYYAKDYKIIICSGRDDTYKEVTEKWLQDNDIIYDAIFMRKAQDKRNDSIVKQEIYEEHIKDQFNIHFVLDDRNRVVNMWRRQGLKVLQCAPGDF